MKLDHLEQPRQRELLEQEISNLDSALQILLKAGGAKEYSSVLLAKCELEEQLEEWELENADGPQEKRQILERRIGADTENMELSRRFQKGDISKTIEYLQGRVGKHVSLLRELDDSEE